MSATAFAKGDPATRPEFRMPFPAGTHCRIQTYAGHNPDDKKMDIYAGGWPDVVAAASGVIHEWFDPGGIEIRHGDTGWFTTYMHMTDRVAVGTHVRRGERVGTPGSVGTGVRHLHHEQLYVAHGATDADNDNIVNPVIYEIGTSNLILNPGHPIDVVSENGKSPSPNPAPTTGHYNAGKHAHALVSPNGEYALFFRDNGKIQIKRNGKHERWL